VFVYALTTVRYAVAEMAKVPCSSLCLADHLAVAAAAAVAAPSSM
jgi:hypothetical protein